MSRSVHETVTTIINQSTKAPTIVNENSNFVVITYWWGRGRLNRNTARPCTSFYEDNLKRFNKLMLKLLNTAVIKEKTENGRNANSERVTERIFQNLTTNPLIFTTLIDGVSKMVKQYINSVCDYKGIDQKVADRFALLKEQYPDFLPNLTSPTQLLIPLFDIVREGIKKNKENLIALHNAQQDYDALKAEYLKYKHNKELQIKNEEGVKKLQELNILLLTSTGQDSAVRGQMRQIAADIAALREGRSVDTRNIKELVDEITKLSAEKEELNKKIVATWKKKDTEGKSIFDNLIDLMEYSPPILFEDMIGIWEEACREHGCNYLAVEYPEFAQEGGYQLAINAKPKFIEKALELCGGRSVLYIDGDMTIRQYPAIFDMRNVDFMARGWWIDPRSSWKMSESIMYDPYNFETSGGTMFFSASTEAQKLIRLWINSAENPTNEGKADDRVLSLIFNTKAVLLWIRTIQLPIEYLWLTLDYDERMMEEVYDYNKPEMESTIMIDHPECLTSEDTATGAGASSNRQPKFYEFLEDLYPCVETTHEYIMFKELVKEFPETAEKVTEFMFLSDIEREQQNIVHTQKLLHIDTELGDPTIRPTRRTQLKADREKIKKEKSEILYLPYLFWYYHYMGDVQYINDGNADLINLGFVDPENPEDNAYPLSIVSYKDKFGNKKHPQDGNVSVNGIVDINIEAASELDLDIFYGDNEDGIKLTDKSGFVELVPTSSSSLTDKLLLRIILRLLLDEKTVVFNPTTFEGYRSSLYDKLVTNLTGFYKNTDLVFHPQHAISMRRSDFYKPKIDMHQVMLFRPEDRLIDFISMQLSLEDLSVFINQGSYEFMSLVRIAYILKQKASGELIGSISQRGGKDLQLPPSLIDDVMKDYSRAFEEKLVKLRKDIFASVKESIKNIGHRMSRKKGAKKRKGTKRKHK